MTEKQTYIDILILSLRKKINILEELEQTLEGESQVLKKSKLSFEEIDRVDEKKGKALEELEKADQGFERVYARVKEELASNQNAYETEIKTMQSLIKKITDYTAKIQAQELRNKQLLEYFLQAKKQEVRSFHFNHKTANQYTSHLANSGTEQSFFFDNKK